MKNKNDVEWVCRAGSGSIDVDEDLAAAKKVEKSYLGNEALYFVQKGVMYGVPYDCIKRIFKRIETIGSRLACCRVNFDSHSIVLCDGDKEIAEIKYGDQREAESVYKSIVARVENIEEGKPQEN